MIATKQKMTLFIISLIVSFIMMSVPACANTQYEDLELEKYNVSMTFSNRYQFIEVVKGEAVSVTSSNPKIVTATICGSSIEIDALGATCVGEAVVTVVGKNGETRELTVSFSSTLKAKKASFTITKTNHSIFDFVSCGSYVSKVTASNENVRIIRDANDQFYIAPIKAGSTQLICEDLYGQKVKVNVTIPQSIVKKYLCKMTDFDYSINDKEGYLVYGDQHYCFQTVNNIPVSITINGRRYSGKSDREGWAKIRIPICKIGTKLSIYVNGTKVGNDTVKNTEFVFIDAKPITRSSKKIRIYGQGLIKGDIVILKYGKKTYKKRVKKTIPYKGKNKYVCTIKFKKNLKAGKCYSVTVKNKYKQRYSKQSPADWKDYVYYGRKVKKGMTKKQVKLTIGWGKPKYVDVYGQYCTWTYNKKYVTFKNGKVIGWGK